MNTSVLLIKSRQNNNHSMGTGFVIHQDSFGSYVLTCAHVIEQVVEPTIEGRSVEIRAMGERESVDLALLYSKGFFRTPLALQQKECSSSDVHLIGYSSFTANQYQGKLREATTLGDKVTLKSVTTDNISEALQIIAKDHNEIERGNSGAPLICSESGKVIAVVSNHKGVHEGYAILIQHLRDIWKEMPPFLFESDDETESPFVGLSAFSIEQAHLFFGRDKEIKEVLQQLGEHNMVTVVGDSGSGKSSVIKAGVIPQYLNGVLDMGSDEASFYCIDMRPANDPFLELSTNISEVAKEFHLDFNSINQIKKAIKSKHYEEIVNALEYIYQKRAIHLLLYVDQFEELFTLCKEKVQHEFIDFLLHLLTEANSFLHIQVVLTVRRDYYNLISSFEAFYQLTQSNKYTLRYMNKQQIRECIEKPLAKTFIDEENIRPFMHAVLRDVGERSNELALLQIALTQTWEHRKEYDNDLLQTYHAIGEVSGALPRLAQSTWEVLTPEEQQLFKYIFIRVVQSGQTGCATRRLARQEEFSQEAWTLAQKLASVLDGHGALADTGNAKLGRLLKIRGEENKSVELVHEALVTQWPMYQRWLGEVTVDNLKHVHDRMIEKLFTYQAHQEKKKFLLLGYELDESMKLLSGGYKDYLSDQEIAYIEKSCTSEKRSQNMKRLVRYGLFTLTITSLYLAGFSYEAKIAAEHQENKLQNVISQIDANYKHQGVKYRDELSQPFKAKLFFKKLLDLNGTASQKKASRILYNSVKTNIKLKRMFEHDKVITNIMLNPNEDKLLSWSHDASLRLRDSRSGREFFSAKHDKIVWSAELSQDEKQIVSSSEDNTVRLWDISTKKEVFPSLEHKGVWRAKFSPDQQQITSWSANQTKVWDRATGQLISETSHRQPLHAKYYDVQRNYFLAKNNTVIDLISVDTNSSLKSFDNNRLISSATFSEDKHEVIIWDDNVTVKILDNTKDSFELLHTIPLANEIAGIIKLGLSPNKQELFIWGVAKKASKGLLLMWDLDKKKITKRYLIPIYPNRYSGAMFIDGGAKLLHWNEDNVQIWDKKSTTPEEILSHNGVIKGVRMSHDDRYIFAYGESGTIYKWERILKHESRPSKDKLNDKKMMRGTLSRDERWQLQWDQNSRDYKVHLIDEKGKVKILDHHGKIYGAEFVDNETKVLSWGSDGRAVLWNRETQKQHFASVEHNSSVVRADYDSRIGSIISLNEEGEVYVSNAKNSHKIIGLATDQEKTKRPSFATNQDKTKLLTWYYVENNQTQRSQVTLWEMKTGEAQGELVLPRHYDVRSARFSEDGTTIMLWGSIVPWERLLVFSPKERTKGTKSPWKFNQQRVNFEGWIGIWDIKSKAWVKDIRRLKSSVIKAKCVNADHQCISWHSDGTVMLSKEGKTVLNYRHNGWVRGASLGPDGRYVLSWGEDGSIELWDIESQIKLVSIDYAYPVIKARFSEDMQQIVSWNSQGIKKTYDLYSEQNLDKKASILEVELESGLEFGVGEIKPLSYEKWKEKKEQYANSKKMRR